MNLNPQNESEAEMDLYGGDMNYSDHNDFFDEIMGEPEACDGEIVEDGDYDEGDCDRCDYDESMDGDFESGMASAGWGTDEDYE